MACRESYAREALGGDRARTFPVAGGVPALNEHAQPLPLVGGELSILKVLGNLGDVAQKQAVLALPIFVCFAEVYNVVGHRRYTDSPPCPLLPMRYP
jgi:hypothetical protein